MLWVKGLRVTKDLNVVRLRLPNWKDESVVGGGRSYSKWAMSGGPAMCASNKPRN